MDMDETQDEKVTTYMIATINSATKSSTFSMLCKSAVETSSEENIWSLLTFDKQIRESDILDFLASSKSFMTRLWHLIITLRSKTALGTATTHIEVLKFGNSLAESGRQRLIPALSMFCSCITTFVQSIDDVDFTDSHLIFSMEELTSIVQILRDVSLGLIDLAFPEEFVPDFYAAEERKKESADRNLQQRNNSSITKQQEIK
uniref:RUN domain-containing protein n=1 Tax=Heterorhabditis bacteriophora TaxID=37862 RepID=A0A1I7X927_HETBA